MPWPKQKRLYLYNDNKLPGLNGDIITLAVQGALPNGSGPIVV